MRTDSATHVARIEVDENPLLNPVHEEEELEIVFEDEWLLVVNKPAGMLSVPGKAEDRDSVYHRLKKKYPEATGPMIVHRLDMATSGLLLVAKTKEVHQDLQAQFANRSIKKRYVAVLDGAIIKTEKEIKPIAEKAILIAKETVLTKNSKSRKNRKYRKNRTPSLSESSRPSSANG